MKKTYKMMMSCLMTCMLMTTLPISGQLINKESNNVCTESLLSFRQDDGLMKMPKADSEWKSLGTASFTDNYICKNSYQVEVQQNISNPQWYRLVQPYHQAKASEGWNSYGTPSDDLQFQLLKKGDNWSVYRDSEWVNEPMEHDSLVWFPWRSTGYYDTFTIDGSSRTDNLRISHPGYWNKWSPQDSILHNRVLSYQSSGYPDVVQLAPYYYVNNLGGWDYTQKDGIVLIKFPTIKTVVINVSTPGTMSNVLFAEIDNWTDVRDLTIIGHINKEDMKFFSRMTKLERLDLSQTDITSITGCNGLANLNTCILPSTVITVEENAFNGCTNLQGINLPNAVTIGKSAFYNCGKITEIELPNAETIGESAFPYCSSLTTVSLPQAVTIGENAFYCSGLNTVSLPQAVTIGFQAFYSCSSLTTVSLPQAETIGDYAFISCSSLTTVSLPQAETIGKYAFQYCNSLNTVSLPQAVTIGYQAFYFCSSLTTVSLPQAVTIGKSAFYRCSSLTTVSLPATLLFIGGDAFAYCSNLSDVYCYVVVPISTTAFDSTGSKNTTLHVPAFSHTAYRLHESWYKFNSIVTLEGLLDNITISSDFSINSSNGLASPVDININGYSSSSSSVSTGHLTIATPDIHIGKLTFESKKYVINGYNSSGSYYSYKTNNTLITHSPVFVNAVDIDLNVETRRWNFLSFPFDVDVSSIEAPDSALWVIRKYSGADRAALTGNTWQNMGEGTTLKAHEGYILHCTDPNDIYNSIMTFKVHAIDNASKGNILACNDVTVPLSSYPSEKAHNRSWNLVGNPYSSYYYTTAIEHQGVLTAWNGSGYTAYSLLDDNYVLSPFEAFFVQCPEDATSMTFKASGRSHTTETETNSNATSWRSPSHGTRQVYNLLLTDGEYTDRTRLVVNENAKMDYETECDASKFMSDDSTVPQLYISDNGIHYAINERPMGNGEFHLGARLGRPGEYTIQLHSKIEVSDPVLLIDNVTGETTDLTKNDYTFTGQTCDNEHRFTLTIGAATGISEIASGNTNNEVYTLDGKRVPKGTLSGGVYVVRKNGKTAKKVVK